MKVTVIVSVYLGESAAQKWGMIHPHHLCDLVIEAAVSWWFVPQSCPPVEAGSGMTSQGLWSHFVLVARRKITLNRILSHLKSLDFNIEILREATVFHSKAGYSVSGEVTSATLRFLQVTLGWPRASPASPRAAALLTPQPEVFLPRVSQETFS